MGKFKVLPFEHELQLMSGPLQLIAVDLSELKANSRPLIITGSG
jgi:hypothetical protein